MEIADIGSGYSKYMHPCQRTILGFSLYTHLFRFALAISFRRAAPSNGFKSSKAHSKSSDIFFFYLLLSSIICATRRGCGNDVCDKGWGWETDGLCLLGLEQFYVSCLPKSV